MKRLTLLLLSLFMYQSASGVVIDNRDWRQLTETTNITWNQMASVCDVVTGICNGTVAGVDVTGWIWADDNVMASLFEVVSGAPAGTFDVPQFNYSERNAYWAEDFIDTDGAGADTGLFAATWQYTLNPERDFSVLGLTRNQVNGNADRSYIRFAEDSVRGDASSAVVGNQVGLDIARSHTGHWLYKEVAVPTPATLGIFLIALGGLGLRSQLRQG